MFIFHLLTIFSDFFPENPILITLLTTFIQINSGNYYFLNCNFNNLKNSNYGGAIYFENNSIFQGLIENCIFLKCSSNLNGGSISITGINSEIILNKNIFNNCSSLEEQFFKISLSNLKRGYSYCNSFINSFNNLLNCQNIFSFFNCQSEVLYSNISNNNLYYFCSFQFFTQSTTNFNFSILSNNYGIKWIGFWFKYDISKINKSNFINNTQNDLTWGFLFLGNGNSNSIFNDCIFINNTNYLIQVTSGILILNSCFLQNYYTSGNIQINSLLLINSTIQISFLNFCNLSNISLSKNKFVNNFLILINFYEFN